MTAFVDPEPQTPRTMKVPFVNQANLTEALGVIEEKTQAMRSKQQNINYSFFTGLFFRNVSQQKQRALDEILKAQTTVLENTKLIIQDKDCSAQEKQVENLKSALTKLYASIDQNIPTLKQYRGFWPNGKTTSDQFALSLKKEAHNLEKTLTPSMSTK